jgi:hypothetical protein
MEDVLVVCSEYLSLPSLFILLRVSSKIRDAILLREVWQSILHRSGFRALANRISVAVIDVSVLNDLRRRIQETKRTCMVCWRTRSPPVRIPSGSIRALCLACDADLLWSRYDISVYMNTLQWRPTKRSLFNKLVIAKRRKMMELFWSYQVKASCEICFVRSVK